MPCATLRVVGAPELEWRNFRIEMDDKVIDPATTDIPVGKEIEVNGDLWNVGTVEATVTTFLTVNGQEVRTATVTIPPGSYIPEGWRISFDEPGEYVVCLGYRL